MTQTEALKLARRAINNLIASSHLKDPQPWRDARQDSVDALTAIEKALAHPEQEPTKLWCETCEGTGEVYQEHQAGCHVGGHFKCPDCDGEGYVLSRLYSTTPPQRTWVDLTEEEIYAAIRSTRFPSTDITVSQSVIEAFKEKNK